VIPDGKPRPDLARKTLTRWKQLGFFTETAGRIELSDEVAAVGADDLGALRTKVLRMVLTPANNPEFDTDGAGDLESTKASDCTRAAAWALAQDPYSFPTKYKGGAEALQDEQGVKPRPFTNDTRWSGFIEWASFLGFGWSSARVGFVPVPWFAVKAVLGDVFGDSREMSQADFFQRLAHALPIVDGGAYRDRIDSQTTRRWRDESPTEVSPSLSAALLTLEASGDLRLEERSDAPQRMLLGRGGRPLHRVSHIERFEGHRA
jgi:hypothetical protein